MVAIAASYVAKIKQGQKKLGEICAPEMYSLGGSTSAGQYQSVSCTSIH